MLTQVVRLDLASVGRNRADQRSPGQPDAAHDILLQLWQRDEDGDATHDLRAWMTPDMARGIATRLLRAADADGNSWYVGSQPDDKP